MNARRIKLALTAALINRKESDNALLSVKEVMNCFVEEVGDFLGLTTTNRAELNARMIHETYVLQYERMSINIDMVSNPLQQVQSVQRFDLR